MGARVAGDSQGAGLSAASVWRDQRELQRPRTRCDSESVSASGSEARVVAEWDADMNGRAIASPTTKPVSLLRSSA